MNKKFRCGRLMLTKNGSIKKIDLQGGGGIRSCPWRYSKMTFKDVHNQLLKIYKLVHKKHKTSLYNFEYQPININQYKTFGEYINKHGLHGNSTVVYLYTREDDDMPEAMSMTENDISSIEQEQVFQDNESHQQIDQSLSEYSFENSMNDLMENVRKLINEDRFDKIFLHLFENISIINGYVFGIIVPLQRHSQEADRLELKIHSNNLNNIYPIFELTKSLLNQNMNNFHHIQIFSTLCNSFYQFYNNLQVLRNRCLKIIQNTNNRITLSTSSTDQSLPLKSTQKPSNKETKRIFSLFQSILKYFNGLLQLIPTNCSSSFHELISSSIEKINSIKSNIKLSDKSSICSSKDVISLIRTQFKKGFNEQEIIPSKSDSDLKLFELCKLTLATMRILCTSLDEYQMKITNDNQQHHSN